MLFMGEHSSGKTRTMSLIANELGEKVAAAHELVSRMLSIINPRDFVATSSKSVASLTIANSAVEISSSLQDYGRLTCNKLNSQDKAYMVFYDLMAHVAKNEALAIQLQLPRDGASKKLKYLHHFGAKPTLNRTQSGKVTPTTADVQKPDLPSRTSRDVPTDYACISKALNTIGFVSQDVQAMHTLLAVCLHLGNVEFKAGTDVSMACQVKSDPWIHHPSYDAASKDQSPLKIAAQLLNVQVAVLET